MRLRSRGEAEEALRGLEGGGPGPLGVNFPEPTCELRLCPLLVQLRLQ